MLCQCNLFLKQRLEENQNKVVAVPFLREPIASFPKTGKKKMAVLLLPCATTREATLFRPITALSAKPPSPTETVTWASRPTGGAPTISAMRQ